MPVDSKHDQYEKRVNQWVRCHDVIEGSDAVKDKADIYLPRLSKQTEADYLAYKMRALFYGASSRTVQGLLGAIFRKPPHVKYPDAYSEHLDLLSANGLSLNGVARRTCKEALSVGRMGILIDVGREDQVGNDANRAYAALYTAESVINWEVKRINNRDELIKVVLAEKYKDEASSDEFESVMKDQYRVLRLDEGVYTQEVWRKADSNGKFVKVPDMDVTPKRIGATLDRIPFIFINDDDLTPETKKPPLLDLIDVNLSHYITSADLEHGAHFTALPTPVVAGFPKDTVLTIGSGVAWVTEDSDAKAYMLEYTGQGLGALRENKQDKEKQMAVLGARLLEEQKAGVEAAETIKIRGTGESSTLSSIGANVSEGLLWVLKKIAWWSGASDTMVESIEFELNNDFVSSKMTPQELAELTKTYQGGAISQETYLYNLKQGEILPHDREIEDEKDMIDADTGGDKGLGGADIPPTPIKREFSVVDGKTGETATVKEE